MIRRKRIMAFIMGIALIGTGLSCNWFRGDKVAQAKEGTQGLLQAGLTIDEQDLLPVARTSGRSGEVFRTNEAQKDGDHYIYGLVFNWSSKRIIFDWASKTSWKVYAVNFVYRDYEAGVTEEKADQEALKLGEESYADWAIDAASYDRTSPLPDYVQLALNSATILADNLTNEVYYAIKFANPDNLSEFVWLRGKLNYRSCAHSPLYDANTTKCTFDEVDGYYEPTLRKSSGSAVLPLPDGYEIVDWETEWRDILQKRWDTVQETLSTTDQYLKNFTDNMKNVEQLLDGLAKTVGTASGTEGITQAALEEQAQRLEGLRSYYSDLLGNSDNGELDKLRVDYQDVLAENRRLKAQLEDLKNVDYSEELAQIRAENEGLKTAYQQLGQTNRDLTEQIADLSAEYSKCLASDREQTGETDSSSNGSEAGSDDQTNLGSNSADSGSDGTSFDDNNNASSGSNGANIVASLVGSTGASSATDSTQADTNTQIISNDAVSGATVEVGNSTNESSNISNVEVPKLGGSTNLNVWLGIALIAVAFGILALWLKRLIAR